MKSKLSTFMGGENKSHLLIVTINAVKLMRIQNKSKRTNMENTSLVGGNALNFPFIKTLILQKNH